MSVCERCNLSSCACASGMTTVTAAGDTPEEARTVAEQYLARRGYTSPVLVGVRRRRTRLGIIGYRAWDLRFRVRDA